MDIDILNRAPEHKAGVPAEPFCTHDDCSASSNPTSRRTRRASPISKRAGPIR